MVTEQKGTKRVTNGAIREELVQELKHLRGLVRETGEQFILRREGEIETIISHLAAVPAGKLRGEAPGLLHGIRCLRLKPDKGRIKDMKGLNGLIEELANRVMSAQDGFNPKGLKSFSWKFRVRTSNQNPKLETRNGVAE
jgi:hypothetical protein